MGGGGDVFNGFNYDAGFGIIRIILFLRSQFVDMPPTQIFFSMILLFLWRKTRENFNEDASFFVNRSQLKLSIFYLYSMRS